MIEIKYIKISTAQFNVHHNEIGKKLVIKLKAMTQLTAQIVII